MKVEYEPLATISSIEEAIATPEPRIHDYGDSGNLHKVVSMTFGEVEKGFEEADEIFEDTFYYEGNTHLPMEQHASVAVPEDDDRVTLYSSSQTPHYVHRALAKVLELPASRVRVVAAPNGGGFGGKSDPFNHEIVAAKMALKLGRPCKITLTREEVFYCHRGRHPVLMQMRTGVKKDGHDHRSAPAHRSRRRRLRQLRRRLRPTTPGALQTVTYKMPAYEFQGVRCFTNKPPCGPKRGHGTPQPRFGFEVHLDKIAIKLGDQPGRPAAQHAGRAGFDHRQLAEDRLDGPAALHRGGGRGERLPRALGASCPRGAASASPAAPTSAARACRSTGTTCRSRA